MAAELLTDASRALDSNAAPYPGATWSFYATGTLTPQAVYANADLSTSLGAMVTADAGGKFVPIYFDASKLYRGILKNAAGSVTIYDIDPLNTGEFTEFAGATFNPAEAYSGTGTATLGAPRWVIGNLTPSGDDSAILLARDISGNLLFSHGERDESEFLSTGDSAYTSFDSSPTYKSNGGVKYNHGYGFQWRSLMAATNGMDLFSGFLSFPRQSAGTIDRLFHFHAQGFNKTGGVTTVQAAFYSSILTGAGGVNYGVYIEGNPSFFGDYIQMNGDDLFGFAQLRGGAAHFTGTISSFETGGGVFVGGAVTASGYAAVRAYNDNAGAVRGLALNYTGGQVLVGTGTPTTGAGFEVNGQVMALTSLRSGSFTVGTVPSASGSGTGSVIYVSSETGGRSPAFSDGTDLAAASPDRAVIA